MNILKDETGILSKQELLKDLNSLETKILERCNKLNDIYFKITGDNELYVISENLAKKILREFTFAIQSYWS